MKGFGIIKIAAALVLAAGVDGVDAQWRHAQPAMIPTFQPINPWI
jgi:hypothetical protein